MSSHELFKIASVSSRMPLLVVRNPPTVKGQPAPSLSRGSQPKRNVWKAIKSPKKAEDEEMEKVVLGQQKGSLMSARKSVSSTLGPPLRRSDYPWVLRAPWILDIIAR